MFSARFLALAVFSVLALPSPAASGSPVSLQINPRRLTAGPVDPKQGGQFIEPLCALIPSMLAQQVADTSFEDDFPWKVAFRKETDRPYRPWYPDGALHLARYALDTNQPFNGRRSFRVDLAALRVRAGVSQDGYYVEPGKDYRLRLHARSQGEVRVQGSLHGRGGPAAPPLLLGRTGPEWGLMEGTFHARQSMENATLTIDFEGPGTLWVDRVSLFAGDAELGLWRPDVVRALRELKPAVIRFGGSTVESYEWDQCIGPADGRAPFPLQPWGGIEENFVGVEEFVALCRAIGAEPLVCLRWSGRTPEAAAAEVEYFNGSSQSPWGARRARNGHAAAWKVKYWQIGNEVGGAPYDAAVGRFAEAMRRVDPAIRVLSAFPSAATLRVSSGQLDYLCPHHYDCADLAGTERSVTALEDQIRQSGSSRLVRIAVTEWNTTAGEWGLTRATLQTLGNALACSRYHQLMHRHADSIEIAIRSNLIDSFGSGVILTGPGWLYLAPTYFAQQLYARGAGSYPIQAEPILAGPRRPRELLQPDLSALLSPDGRVLRLYGVNDGDKMIEVATELMEFPGGVRTCGVYRLRDARHGGSPEVQNTRDDPERIGLLHEKCGVKGTRFKLPFEPYSVTLYEMELELAGR